MIALVVIVALYLIIATVVLANVRPTVLGLGRVRPLRYVAAVVFSLLWVVSVPSVWLFDEVDQL
jgi:hypothetical protein